MPTITFSNVPSDVSLSKQQTPKNILKVASIFNVWLNTSRRFFRELTWPQFVEKIWIFKIYHHANESVETDAVYLYRLLVSEKNKTFTSRLFISLLVFFKIINCWFYEYGLTFEHMWNVGWLISATTCEIIMAYCQNLCWLVTNSFVREKIVKTYSCPVNTIKRKKNYLSSRH